MSLFNSNLFQNCSQFQSPKLSLPIQPQSAFIIPKASVPFPQFSPNAYPLSTIHNPINPQQKILRSAYNDNDPDLLMYEPVKKVKLDNTQSRIIEGARGNGNSTHHPIKMTPMALTLEEVFNTSKNNQWDEAEECNLSFISSSSSLEILEEEDNDCMIIEPPVKKVPASEPLAVKDSLFENPFLFNQINTINININKTFNNPLNNINSLMDFQQKLQTFQEFQENKLFSEIKPNITLHSFNSFTSNELYKSKESTRDVSDQDAVKIEEDKPVINKAILNDFDNDLDSNCTGSTGLGLDSRNSSAMESIIEACKGQKEISPFCNFAADVFPEQPVQVKRGRGRPRKGEKVEKKQKPLSKTKKKFQHESKSLLEYNSLNLNLTSKKGNRGLNRLQLLKYQETIPEIEEETKNQGSVDYPELNSQEQRNKFKKNNNQDYTISDENPVSVPIGENHQIVIQPFVASKSTQRRKGPLVPVWNPENEDQEVLRNYLEELSKVIESPVTNQERAFKLLKSFSMNIEAVLEVVREDVPLYKEHFKVKWNKFRGCRLGY